MKKSPLLFFRRSLSARLSAYIVLFAALLLLLALGYLFRVTSQAARSEASDRAEQVLDNTVLRVNDILEDVEVVADNLAWLVERDIDNPDAMVTYSNQAVRNNAFLKGCSISFAPWYYREKGEYYSIFSYRALDGSVQWEQEGDESYQYFYKIWYQLPQLLGHSCWTEPYDDLDVEDDDEMDTGMLVSYCMPIYDRDSNFVASISLDLSLKWLSQSVSDLKPYPNAYSMMIGHGGTYLVHPDPEKLFYQTLFTNGLLEPDPDKYALGQSMRKQESGMREMTVEGVRSFVFYKPIQTNGWSVAIVCPESDIFGKIKQLRRGAALNVLLGLLLMFFVFSWIIRKMLAPLSTLADEASIIAAGDLEHPLKTDGRMDEVGVLNNSFGNMQSSLVKYIDELTKTTASNERIERELQIARNIQMSMVPHEFPSREDVDLYGSMTPAKEVGGDLYDFFIQGEKLYFCIGDVSGKSVPASLIMAVSRGMFRILARQELLPDEIACRINDTIAEENEQLIFVTMFIGRVDLATGVLSYCNCGHNAPVLLQGHGREAAFLDCIPNTAVGVVPGFAYQCQQVSDFRGKVLFLYTDGLNEAENAEQCQFGNERMLAEISGRPFQDARELVHRLGEAVSGHVAGCEPNDDLTMLCVRVL